MTATTSFLDVQTLAQLTCERSKQWAKYMEHYSQDATVEIGMDEIEDVFANYNYDEIAEEENDNEEEEAIECEEGEDIEEDNADLDITNCSIIKCEKTPNNSIKQFALVDNQGNIEKNQKLQDFLNETLNIFSEHQRHLRESGVDRMLQTFDAKKIEATLGGWLQKHNKTLDLSYSIPHKLFTKSHPRNHNCSSKPLVSFAQSKCNDSDSESMHSIDTAQYIRSSRKHQTISQKKRASATTTMTIKTFRMLKSKRDALKQKYACAEHDEHHLEEVKMRRRQRKFEEMHAYTECHHNSLTYYHQKKEKRRKQLRKRRSTCSQSYSSSDMSMATSDSDSHSDDYSSCYCVTHMPGSSIKRMPSCKQKCHRRNCGCGLQATTPQSCHIIQSYKMLESQKKRRQHNISRELLDARPCRRESECLCKNQKMLCRSYRHVVNSSSEDWFVENCLTPKNNKINSAKLELLTAVRAQAMSNYNKSNIKQRKLNIDKKENSNSDLSEISNDTKIEQEKTIKKGNKTNLKKEEIDTIEISDDDSDKPKNLKKRATKKASTKEKSKDKCKLENSDDDDTVFKEDLKKAIMESKALYEQQTTKTVPNDCETTPKINIHRTKKRLDQLASTLKPQPKSAKLRKLADLSGSSSFLANANNICNSTAVANSSTINGRRFGNDLKSFALTKYNYKDKSKLQKPKENDIDCTIVTSTTDAVNCSSNQQPSKGIIIYKPKEQNDGASSSQSYFNVTQEHLAAVIGEKSASKFLKYYVGRRRFDSNSTIYYRPPQPSTSLSVSSSASSQLAKADSNGHNTDLSECDEDDDILECVNQYGELYESVN